MTLASSLTGFTGIASLGLLSTLPLGCGGDSTTDDTGGGHYGGVTSTTTTTTGVGGQGGEATGGGGGIGGEGGSGGTGGSGGSIDLNHPTGDTAIVFSSDFAQPNVDGSLTKVPLSTFEAEPSFATTHYDSVLRSYGDRLFV